LGDITPSGVGDAAAMARAVIGSGALTGDGMSSMRRGTLLGGGVFNSGGGGGGSQQLMQMLEAQGNAIKMLAEGMVKVSEKLDWMDKNTMYGSPMAS
jgi:hypothetical protein